MTVRKVIMGWNTLPSTCLVGTELALHYIHKADFLDTLDLRGGVETAEAEAKFKNMIKQTKLYTHMSIWTLHRHLLTTPCSYLFPLVLVACLPFHCISVDYHDCTYIYPDGFNGLFYLVCFSLTDSPLQQATLRVRLANLEFK
jgi:hypothetical protein